MEEQYLLACTRYVELNLIRAGLVKKPEEWPWSCAEPHMESKNDVLKSKARFKALSDEKIEEVQKEIDLKWKGYENQ